VLTDFGQSSTYKNKKKGSYPHESGVITERMRDSVPAYFSRAVRDDLSNASHDRRIDRGGFPAWLPRSPDLNPLEFYLWEHIKTLVYAAPVDNEETHRIVDACQTIRSYSRHL
jgi:hypothetical protein